eukprot:TRINITY_DN90382_c0_g1_i1.p1 TRINITY_DN90382_c0_g1~~TRINITY_DN90382_c0_g1_i1.p1  ORF type:complete len:395 (-),score=110.91 TRINITY_DN90382_c0_g1_i1:605-1789(-)
MAPEVPAAAAAAQDSKNVNHLVAAQLMKTKMCVMFQKGACRDKKCRYAHSEKELRLAPDLTKTSICRMYVRGKCNDSNCKFAHGEQELRVTPQVYRTQVCNYYRNGNCKKGAWCRHAHESDDLRSFDYQLAVSAQSKQRAAEQADDAKSDGSAPSTPPQGKMLSPGRIMPETPVKEKPDAADGVVPVTPVKVAPPRAALLSSPPLSPPKLSKPAKRDSTPTAKTRTKLEDAMNMLTSPMKVSPPSDLKASPLPPGLEARGQPFSTLPVAAAAAAASAQIAAATAGAHFAAVQSKSPAPTVFQDVLAAALGARAQPDASQAFNAALTARLAAAAATQAGPDPFGAVNGMDALSFAATLGMPAFPGCMAAKTAGKTKTFDAPATSDSAVEEEHWLL